MSETNEPIRDLEVDGELETYVPDPSTHNQSDLADSQLTPDTEQSLDSTNSLESSSLAVHRLDPEAESLDQESTEHASEPLTGFELVADMMRRQDEVLQQIDDLDGRINAMINQITAEREAEKLAELAAIELAEQGSSENVSDTVEADQNLVRRAA